MNLIEKIIILVIILLILNHFSKGTISDVVKRNIDKFVNSTPNTTNLNDYLKTLISNTKFNLNKNNQNKIQANNIVIKQILESLKILSNNEFRFGNLTINDNVYYYNYPNGKLIKPFILNCAVKQNNKIIGNFNIEIIAFLNDNGNINILDIKTVQNKIKPAYKFKTKKQQKQAINENRKLANKMTEDFNNHFVSRDDHDDLFIKPTEHYNNVNFENDTENSLIPSIIEFSNDYESSSDTE